MQILPGPGFLAEPALRLCAQLPQSRPGALCPILVRGETGQVLTDQSVHSGVAFGGMAANGGQDILVHAESDVLHDHSICVTVWIRNPVMNSDAPCRRTNRYAPPPQRDARGCGDGFQRRFRLGQSCDYRRMVAMLAGCMACPPPVARVVAGDG